MAYEGAAMAMALLGILLPGRLARLARFLEGPGSPHVYMYVGVGWALAALHVPLTPFLRRLDPVCAGWPSTAWASTPVSLVRKFGED